MKKMINGKATKLSRRNFIVGSTVAAGGGLALGFHLPLGIGSAAAQSAAAAGAEVNAWVVVKPDDTCVIRIARSEMGQGTRTGLAQLVAEGSNAIGRRSPPSRLPRVRISAASASGARWEPAAAAASAPRRIMSAAAALLPA